VRLQDCAPLDAHQTLAENHLTSQAKIKELEDGFLKLHDAHLMGKRDEDLNTMRHCEIANSLQEHKAETRLEHEGLIRTLEEHGISSVARREGPAYSFGQWEERANMEYEEWCRHFEQRKLDGENHVESVATRIHQDLAEKLDQRLQMFTPMETHRMLENRLQLFTPREAHESLQEVHQKLEERLYYFTPLSVHQDLERRSVKAIQILEHRLHNYAPLEAYQSLEERLQGYVSRTSEVDGSSQTNIKDLEDSLLKFHDACDTSLGKSLAMSDHANMHRDLGWTSYVEHRPSGTVPSINTLEDWRVAFDKIAKAMHSEDEEHHMLIETLAARFEEEATGHHESFDSQRSSTNRLAFDVAELKDAYRELEDSLPRRSLNDRVNRVMPQEERSRIESLLELERGAPIFKCWRSSLVLRSPILIVLCDVWRTLLL